MRRYGISKEAWAKFDEGLRQAVRRLGGNPSAELPVMVSLWSRHAGQNREQMAMQFQEESQGLMQELARLGAKDVEGYWINSTASARVPIAALDVLGRRSDVKQILLIQPRKVVC